MSSDVGGRDPMASAGRRAVVLPVALLLLLAATALVHGAFVMASALLRGGDEAWHAVQVRRAAGAVATLAARDVPGVASGVVADRVAVGVAARPLSPEITIFEGWARTAGASWTAGRLRWRAHPLARAADGASIRWGGRLARAGALTRLEAAAGSSCGLPALPALLAPLRPRGVSIGPLDGDGLAALLPAGIPNGACSGPCPVVAAVAGGPVRLSTGTFSGLLLVRGDLELSGDVHLAGVLLVEGDLRILGSARVEGAVQVEGDLSLADAASLVGDACTVAAAWRDGVGDQVGPVLLEFAPWPLWGGLP